MNEETLRRIQQYELLAYRALNNPEISFLDGRRIACDLFRQAKDLGSVRATKELADIYYQKIENEKEAVALYSQISSYYPSDDEIKSKVKKYYWKQCEKWTKRILICTAVFFIGSIFITAYTHATNY